MRPHASAKMALVILGLVGVGVGVDQITKAWAVRSLGRGEIVALVSDIFKLQLYRNPGAAFSTGTSLTVVFAALAVIVLVAVSWWVVPRVHCLRWAIAVGLGMAGVAGNLVDRLVQPPGVMRGYVIDFFALKYFAVFNVADVLLTAAAIMIVVLALFIRLDFNGERTPRPKAPVAGSQ